MNSFIKSLTFFLIGLVLTVLPAKLFGQSEPVYIKGGSYFDVDSKQMVKNEGILIRGGRFYEIGDAPSQANQGDYRTIELENDEYVLPGIVDIHAHFVWMRLDRTAWKKLTSLNTIPWLIWRMA